MNKLIILFIILIIVFICATGSLNKNSELNCNKSNITIVELTGTLG